MGNSVGGDDLLGPVAADITDEAGTLVCQAIFEWSIRRISPA
ncbi:MAG TPA: hypothetical protein VLW50_12595 [Streptosporangiaceae bacterium]|nr:hypothetical protein [Streptosporangiaceae bacterium]